MYLIDSKLKDHVCTRGNIDSPHFDLWYKLIENIYCKDTGKWSFAIEKVLWFESELVYDLVVVIMILTIIMDYKCLKELIQPLD